MARPRAEQQPQRAAVSGWSGGTAGGVAPAAERGSSALARSCRSRAAGGEGAFFHRSAAFDPVRRSEGTGGTAAVDVGTRSAGAVATAADPLSGPRAHAGR